MSLRPHSQRSSVFLTRLSLTGSKTNERCIQLWKNTSGGRPRSSWRRPREEERLVPGRRTMKKLGLLVIFPMMILACGGDGGPTSPTPQTTTTTAPVQPTLTSHEAKISRSSGGYHYISWKFTIDSPKYYSYAYVEAKWYDADGFQIDWTNWVGALQQGIHTYTDETMIKKDVWARVKSRTVELKSWY